MSRSYEYWIAEQLEPQLTEQVKGLGPRRLTEREIRDKEHQARVVDLQREQEYQEWLDKKPINQ